MINHIILTVSDVERSLVFYDAALKPLKIRFFLPCKGERGHPDLWGLGDGTRACFWLKQRKPHPGSIHWGFDALEVLRVARRHRTAATGFRSMFLKVDGKTQNRDDWVRMKVGKVEPLQSASIQVLPALSTSIGHPCTARSRAHVAGGALVVRTGSTYTHPRRSMR